MELVIFIPFKNKLTLIVELSKHSTDPIASMQARGRQELAWSGLLYLWLLEAKVRTPQQLAQMSLAAQRNTTIVENHNHTGKTIGDLQHLNNWQLTELAYGW